jgi:hypothetical protein
MRLDMPEQRPRQMDTKQIRQRRIGTVEVHARCVWREQSRLVGRHQIVLFGWLVHWLLLFVPPGF